MDLVEVGQNWKNFYWPSKFPFVPAIGKVFLSLISANINILAESPKNCVASVNQRLFHSQSDIDRQIYAVGLISAMGNIINASIINGNLLFMKIP